MPRSVNHVYTRQTYTRNPDEFPDDPRPPTWRSVTRGGTHIGWVWYRNPPLGTPAAERWATRAVTVDGTTIGTFPTKAAALEALDQHSRMVAS